jgi:hypothetical protein
MAASTVGGLLSRNKNLAPLTMSADLSVTMSSTIQRQHVDYRAAKDPKA